MKLIEIKDMKPLLWTILEKLVGGDGAVDIDVATGDGNERMHVYGHIYSSTPVYNAFNNKPCEIEDAGALWLRYTPQTTAGKRIDSLRSFYLLLDADDKYTIKKINDIPTMVNV